MKHCNGSVEEFWFEIRMENFIQQNCIKLHFECTLRVSIKIFDIESNINRMEKFSWDFALGTFALSLSFSNKNIYKLNICEMSIMI